MHNSVHRGAHCQKKNWHSRTIPRRKRIDFKKSEGMTRAQHYALQRIPESMVYKEPAQPDDPSAGKEDTQNE